MGGVEEAVKRRAEGGKGRRADSRVG